MCPPATDGVEKPAPRPVAFQRSFGPPSGHFLSRPVSFDRPVRSGPRHAGQSPGLAWSWARAEGLVERSRAPAARLSKRLTSMHRLLWVRGRDRKAALPGVWVGGPRAAEVIVQRSRPAGHSLSL